MNPSSSADSLSASLSRSAFAPHRGASGFQSFSSPSVSPTPMHFAGHGGAGAVGMRSVTPQGMPAFVIAVHQSDGLTVQQRAWGMNSQSQLRVSPHQLSSGYSLHQLNMHASMQVSPARSRATSGDLHQLAPPTSVGTIDFRSVMPFNLQHHLALPPLQHAPLTPAAAYDLQMSLPPLSLPPAATSPSSLSASTERCSVQHARSRSSADLGQDVPASACASASTSSMADHGEGHTVVAVAPLSTTLAPSSMLAAAASSVPAAAPALDPVGQQMASSWALLARFPQLAQSARQHVQQLDKVMDAVCAEIRKALTPRSASTASSTASVAGTVATVATVAIESDQDQSGGDECTTDDDRVATDDEGAATDDDGRSASAGEDNMDSGADTGTEAEAMAACPPDSDSPLLRAQLARVGAQFCRAGIDVVLMHRDAALVLEAEGWTGGANQVEIVRTENDLLYDDEESSDSAAAMHDSSASGSGTSGSGSSRDDQDEDDDAPPRQRTPKKFKVSRGQSVSSTSPTSVAAFDRGSGGGGGGDAESEAGDDEDESSSARSRKQKASKGKVAGSKRKKPAPKGNSVAFTNEQTVTLRKYFSLHLEDPYPDHEIKERLAEETGLSYEQVQHWFINARCRFWRPMLHRQKELLASGLSLSSVRETLATDETVAAPSRSKKASAAAAAGKLNLSDLSSAASQAEKASASASNFPDLREGLGHGIFATECIPAGADSTAAASHSLSRFVPRSGRSYFCDASDAFADDAVTASRKATKSASSSVPSTTSRADLLAASTLALTIAASYQTPHRYRKEHPLHRDQHKYKSGGSGGGKRTTGVAVKSEPRAPRVRRPTKVKREVEEVEDDGEEENE